MNSYQKRKMQSREVYIAQIVSVEVSESVFSVCRGLGIKKTSSFCSSWAENQLKNTPLWGKGGYFLATYDKE